MKKKRHPAAGLIQTGAAALGSLFGGPSGAVVGGHAGRLMNHILGIGSYQNSLKRNDLFDPRLGVPTMNSTSGDGSVVISRREFLQNVSGSVAFTSTKIPLNPGLITSFPYVAAIASQFEFYEFEGLVYYFRSTSATAVSSTNTALGTVIMAAEYNVNSPDFTSKQQAETTRYVQSGKPSEDLIFPIECDPRELDRINYMVRTGSLPSGGVISDYDMANVYFMTEGMQAANTIGELWVSYKIRLRNPIIRSVSTPALSRTTITAVGYTLSSWLGTTPTVSSVGTSFVSSATGNFVTFNRTGTYLWMFALQGTITNSSLGTAQPITAGTGSLASINAISPSGSTEWGGTNTRLLHNIVVTVSTVPFTLDVRSPSDSMSSLSGDILDIILLS